MTECEDNCVLESQTPKGLLTLMYLTYSSFVRLEAMIAYIALSLLTKEPMSMLAVHFVF